jgi:hypothetical protein
MNWENFDTEIRYFTRDEISCPCCGLIHDTDESWQFLKRMDCAREYAGVVFHINSWTRCKEHNRYVDGSPTSSHLKGVAADIKCDNPQTRQAIIEICAPSFPRILIYPIFLHIDSDEMKTGGIYYMQYNSKIKKWEAR